MIKRFTQLLLIAIIIGSSASDLFAETEISAGNITTTTWTKANSPYNINGNIEVPDGDSLIIEPGVEVICTGDFAINIYGRLLAEGQENDSIVFTSSSEYWEGININTSLMDTTIIDYCRIDKSASSGIYCDSSKIRISNSHIYDNYSGGIVCLESSSRILNNLIENNTKSGDGGGILCSYGTSTISNNVVKGNHASAAGGGIRLTYTTSTVSFNIICRNSSSIRSGGFESAFEGGEGVSEITNNTIINNSSPSTGGVFSYQVADNYRNNVIWGNSNGQISGLSPAPSIEYCAIESGTSLATTNTVILDEMNLNGGINPSPMFNNIELDDYSLLPGSPLIGSGTPANTNIGAMDSTITVGRLLMTSESANADVNPEMSYTDMNSEFVFTIQSSSAYSPDMLIYNGTDVLDAVQGSDGIYFYTIENVTEDGHLNATVALLLDYSISYNTDRGTPVEPNVDSYNRLSDTIFLNDLESSGYVFLGWYNNPDFNGEAITQIDRGSTGDIELWASWRQNQVAGLLESTRRKYNSYPNPVNDRLFVEFNKPAEVSGVELLNILGKKIYSSTEIFNSVLEINLEDQPQGLFIIRISDNYGKTYTDKLIKQ